MLTPLTSRALRGWTATDSPCPETRPPYRRRSRVERWTSPGFRRRWRTRFESRTSSRRRRWTRPRPHCSSSISTPHALRRSRMLGCAAHSLMHWTPSVWAPLWMARCNPPTATSLPPAQRMNRSRNRPTPMIQAERARCSASRDGRTATATACGKKVAGGSGSQSMRTRCRPNFPRRSELLTRLR